MSIQYIVDEALNTPMTRKQFFARMGRVLLAVVGVTAVLHALSGQQDQGTRSAGGYGGGPYGGRNPA